MRRLKKVIRKLYSPNFADNFGVRLPLTHPFITPGIAKEIYFGTYERKEAEIITQRLEPDDVVMEIGAGIGFLSAYCAKRVGNERVYAYEANPDLMDLIGQTHEANGVHPTVRNVLLAKGSGKARFYLAQ